MTRVRFSSILWKLTMPECCVPLVVFHAMRSFLRRSTTLPFHWRLLNQIFSSHCTSSLPSLLFWTLSTRCMNCGYFSKSVHASYALSTGTATSVQRWIGSRRVFLFLPPPPPGVTLSTTLPATFPITPDPPASPSVILPTACLPILAASSLPRSSSFGSSCSRNRSGAFRTAYVAAIVPTPAAAGSRNFFARLPLPFPFPLPESFSLPCSATFSTVSVALSAIRPPRGYRAGKLRRRSVSLERTCRERLQLRGWRRGRGRRRKLGPRPSPPQRPEPEGVWRVRRR